MDIPSQYNVFINNQIVGTIFTGTLVLTLLVFLWLYYFNVQRNLLVRVVLLVTFASLVGLVADSLLAFGYVNDGPVLPISVLEKISVISEVLTIYAIYVISVIMAKSNVSWKRIILAGLGLLMLMISFFARSYINPINAYAMICLLVALYKGYREKNMRLVVYSSIVHGALLLIYNVSVYGSRMLEVQWLFDSIVVLMIIIYFMSQYKQVIVEKEKLLKRLGQDALTMAKSKSSFLNDVENAKDGTIIFMDINKFKYVNDRNGHVVGDNLLKGFASEVDKRELGNLARFGGDEFTMLIDNNENKQKVVSELIAAFSTVKSKLGLDDIKELGISLGVVEFYNGRGMQAVETADEAMYEAKSKGNYRVKEMVVG